MIDAMVPPVTSRGRTMIACDKGGSRPVVFIVGGALPSRHGWTAPRLAKPLATGFAAVTCDRRGRGGSTDDPEYESTREMEDVPFSTSSAGRGAYTGCPLATLVSALEFFSGA